MTNYYVARLTSGNSVYQGITIEIRNVESYTVRDLYNFIVNSTIKEANNDKSNSHVYSKDNTIIDIFFLKSEP